MADVVVVVVELLALLRVPDGHHGGQRVAHHLERADGVGGHGRLGFRGQSAAPTLQTVGADALAHHADLKALLVAAELAPVAPPLVHHAVHGARADVLGVLLHGPLEEALASLAGAHAVVLAGGVVAADCANVQLARRALLHPAHSYLFGLLALRLAYRLAYLLALLRLLLLLLHLYLAVVEVDLVRLVLLVRLVRLRLRLRMLMLMVVLVVVVLVVELVVLVHVIVVELLLGMLKLLAVL